MPEPRNKRILFAVLNWGLGHATRSIPLIQALSEHNEVFIASTGRSLDLLRQEFPELPYVDFPDYGSHYSKSGYLLIPYLGLQMPIILGRLVKERRRTERLIRQHRLDMVFSDSRFGVYSPTVPSYFITHQLRFPLPGVLRKLEFLSEWYNRYFFQRFTRIFVVDVKERPNLSRDLSHKGKITHHEKLVYLGALSSIKPRETTEDIDLLISISGPEAARTVFESTIMQQVQSVPGKKMVVLGKPGAPNGYEKLDDLEIYPHVPRERMNELMNRAKLIVTRSGYSTVMELIALGKKAILVPTPGQTEQEYLAEYYQQERMFHVAKQRKLDLKREIAQAQESNNHHLPRIPVNDIDKFFTHIAG